MIGLLNFVIRNLKRRKLRNWITIFGIVIGVVAIVSLISLSEGLKSTINKEFNNLGSQRITIISKYQGFGGKSSLGLKDEDIENIEKIADVDYATGSLRGSYDVKYGQKTLALTIASYEKDYFEKMLTQENRELLKGTYISSDKAKEVVVGYDFVNPEKVDDLFGKVLGIGKKIKVNDEEYTIVGILKKTGDARKDSMIYLSNDNLKELSESETYAMIFAINKDGKNIEETSKKIEDMLERKRGSKDVFVTNPVQITKSRDETLGIVSVVIIGIACISLLVGGIGILNSMYTSVFERKREIGLLKAIGAKKSDILKIFLLESGIIGLIGGILGIILGFSLALLVKLVAMQLNVDVSVLISFNIVILALGFSFLIGVVSGMIPAYLASSQEPVDALKEE